MKKIKFSCGCEFEQNEQGKILIPIDTFWDNLNYKCSAAWDLINKGGVKCGFQIESSFGQQLVKQLKFSTIDDIGHLSAIMRPSCTDAKMDDGKSLTEHYIMRVNGKEEPVPFHKALEPYLRDTQQILVYQEQASQIVQAIAGFTASEADDLRKACAKKRADLMAPLQEKFIKGCKEKGLVGESDALNVWQWLEAGQRYGFNRSHAVAYSYVTYASIYVKAHFPQQTYCDWLSFTKEEPETQKEIYELYHDAKQNGYDIFGPDFRLLNKNFVISNGNIYFGIIDVHGIGESVADAVILTTKQIEESIGSRYSWSYLDLMFRLLLNVGSVAATNLISAGAFDYICSKRTQTKYEYEHLSKLKDTVMPWILENYHKYSSVIEVLEALLKEFRFRQPRSREIVEEILESIKNPLYKLEDSAAWLAGEERRLLGVSVTCSSVDECNIDAANASCYDYLQGRTGYLIIPVFVDDVREATIKNGKNAGKKMAFLKVSDSTGAISDLAVFSECWSESKMYIVKGNTILLAGKRDNKSKKTWQIEKVWQI